MESFFSPLTLPKTNDEQKTELEWAYNTLRSGKAPGPGGFSLEFHKQFKSLMVKPLLNMFNDRVSPQNHFQKQTLARFLSRINQGMNFHPSVLSNGSLAKGSGTMLEGYSTSFSYVIVTILKLSSLWQAPNSDLVSPLLLSAFPPRFLSPRLSPVPALLMFCQSS